MCALTQSSELLKMHIDKSVVRSPQHRVGGSAYTCSTHALFNSETLGEEGCRLSTTSGRHVAVFHGKGQADSGRGSLGVITACVYLERPAYQHVVGGLINLSWNNSL